MSQPPDAPQQLAPPYLLGETMDFRQNFPPHRLLPDASLLPLPPNGRDLTIKFSVV